MPLRNCSPPRSPKSLERRRISARRSNLGLPSMPDKRVRRTKAGIQTVLADDNPMTVRQVFYQLVVRDLIEKTEKEYQHTVIRLLTEMRLEDEIPFEWIVDESRRRRQTQTYDNITDAVHDTAKFYRRSALRECPDYI